MIIIIIRYYIYSPKGVYVSKRLFGRCNFITFIELNLAMFLRWFHIGHFMANEVIVARTVGGF